MLKKLYILGYIITLVAIIGCSKSKIYYDVPILIGKNIDETRTLLQELENKENPYLKSLSFQQDHYEINGRTLLINFNPKTRKVTQLSLVYPKGYRNKDEILKAGNLQENTKNYKCEIFADDWSLSPFTSYNGVTIIPIH